MTAGFRESADGQTAARLAHQTDVVQRPRARCLPTLRVDRRTLEPAPALDPEMVFVPAGSLFDYRGFRQSIRHSCRAADAMRTRSAGTDRRWPVSPLQETAISRAQPLERPQALRA